MSTEPLWRGKTEDRAAPFFDGTCSVIEVHLAEPPGTEVEVWPAGDRHPLHQLDTDTGVVSRPGDRTRPGGTPHADLINVAATLARLSFFAGVEADEISDQTRDNIIGLAQRVKSAADTARSNVEYLERVAFVGTDDQPLAIAKFWERRTPPVGPDYVTLRAYEGQENLHIDGEYAVYRRTDGPPGDRPTREQLLDVMHECCRLWNAMGGEEECEACVQRADAVFELLHGQGDETDGR